MSTKGERLAQFVDIQGGDYNAFGQKVGIAGKTLKEIVKGDRPFGAITQEKIGEAYPNLSMSWLLFENGPMYLKNFVEVEEIKIASEPDLKIYDSDPGEEMLLKYLERESVQAKLRQILTNK